MTKFTTIKAPKMRLILLLLALVGALFITDSEAAGKRKAQAKSAAESRDVETEVRQRFNYWEKKYSYSPDDPAFTAIYTEEQRQAQRLAAEAMFADLTAAANNTAGPRAFTIPAGIYRVAPGQIKIKDVSNFTIRAPGVEMLLDSEKSGAAFSFVSCTNVKLTGRAAGKQAGPVEPGAKVLVIDSEQLPMSVARILAVDAKAGTLDVEILPGYLAELPDSERMIAYDTQGRMLNCEQMGWKSVTPLDGRKLQLKTPSLNNPLNREKVLIPGALLALHNNPGHSLRTHSAFSAYACKDMTYESIRVYNGGGAPADHGTAGYTVFRDWQLYPRPGTSRLPIATGLGQFSKNGGTFLFENCSFGPHLDDGINLLSGMSIVGKSNGETEIVLTGWEQPTVGSTLSFYDYTTWESFGEAKVVSSEKITDDETRAEVNAFAKKNRTVQNARNAFRTILDKPIKMNPFAMVVHSDYRADGIVVRGCLFRDQLAQIMLIQGAKSGLIENNLLLRSPGGGVSAQFSQYWWEGPMPENLVIRNNVFRDNPLVSAVNGFDGNGAVAIYAGTKYPTDARLMHHFRIEGNTIINPSVYGIVVRNTEDVVIRKNRIINPGAYEVKGKFRDRPISELYAAICLDAVSNAEVTDNKIVYGNQRCQRAVLMEANCDSATVKLERNREIHQEAAATTSAKAQ